MTKVSPWTPAQATDSIRKIARSDNLTITYKKHAKDRMVERGLIISDIIYVLENGFVYLKPIPSTRTGLNKYAVESRSPNSERRVVRVVVIPDKKAHFLKIISVMWVDEESTKEGTIIGEYDE